MSPIYRIAYIYFVSQEKHFSLREGLDSLTGRIFFRGNPETPAPLPSCVLRIQRINQLINSQDLETTSLNLAQNGSISLDLNSWVKIVGLPLFFFSICSISQSH